MLSEMSLLYSYSSSGRYQLRRPRNAALPGLESGRKGSIGEMICGIKRVESAELISIACEVVDVAMVHTNLKLPNATKKHGMISLASESEQETLKCATSKANSKQEPVVCEAGHQIDEKEEGA